MVAMTSTVHKYINVAWKSTSSTQRLLLFVLIRLKKKQAGMGYVSSPDFHGTYLPINQSTFYRPTPEPPSKKKNWPDTDTLKNWLFKVPGSGYFMLYGT